MGLRVPVPFANRTAVSSNAPKPSAISSDVIAWDSCAALLPASAQPPLSRLKAVRNAAATREGHSPAVMVSTGMPAASMSAAVECAPHAAASSMSVMRRRLSTGGRWRSLLADFSWARRVLDAKSDS